MIEVFKTDVQKVAQSEMIVEKLLEHFPDSDINFDLEDCDRILRVYDLNISSKKIIELLNSYGYQCEVLQ
jgi:hypothetical protein